MERETFVYCVEIEWQNKDDTFRDEFHGYAGTPGEAAKSLLAAIHDGLKRPGHPAPDRETSRVVAINELGPVAFKG